MNKFEKYPAYKDSGVEWLGEIPESWEVKKLKYALKFTTGGTPSSGVESYYNGEEPWVTISDMTGRYIEKSHFISKKAIRECNMQIVPKNSLLYSFKLSVGQVAFTKEKIYTNEAIASFYPSKDIDLNFWYYVLPIFLIKNANTNIYGAFLLNQDLINNALIIFPPLHEQTQIASFLDEKTAQIDKAISQKEKLIELLKERKQIVINDAVTKGLDKDVEFIDEWIGKIPKHWEVRRLSSLGFFSKGGGISRDKLVENGLPAILYGDIYTKYNYQTVETKNFISLETSLKAIKIFENDILFTGSGETKEDIGKCIVFKGYEAFAGGDIIIFKQNKANSNFLSYSLSSSYSIMQKMIMAKGEIIVHIYGSKLKDLIVFFPPKSEQLQIVEYIESQITKIDKAIELQLSYISKLKEYKATLIDSVVTGKVRVKQ